MFVFPMRALAAVLLVSLSSSSVAGRGFANYQTGNFEDAVGYLERAATLRPPATGLMNTLGDAYAHLGDGEAMRRAFERSLELNPDQPEIQKRLAR